MNFQPDLFTGRFSYSGTDLWLRPLARAHSPGWPSVAIPATGNGWCGVGWTLDVGYIQRDVRHGVPILWTSGLATTWQQRQYTAAFPELST